MSINDHGPYHAAIAQAERHARQSYFNQHVIEDRVADYVAIGEGDYPLLPAHLIDRIRYTVKSTRIDEH